MRQPRLLLWLAVLCVVRVVQACNPGYTGENCQYPICDVYEMLEHHDGEADYGDMIDTEFSESCNDTFILPVDEYMDTVYVTVTGSNNAANLIGELTTEDGTVIESNMREEYEGYSVRYTYKRLGILHGFGLYKFVLVSYGERRCVYTAFAPTRLVIDGGFITDLRNDQVQTRIPQPHEGVQKSPVVSVASYFAFGIPQFLAYPSAPLKVGIYTNRLKETDYDVSPRFKCRAHAYVGPITCTDTSSLYYMKVIGIDGQGNKWQRVYEFNCDATPPTGPPTTPGPPEVCFNGGVMVNITGGLQECWCPMYFEGYQCQVKQCMNDGTLDSDDRCLCKEGFTGTYCQHVSCKSSTGQSFDLSSKALIFIVRATRTNNVNRQQIRRAAERAVTLYSDHTYYMRYVLITFANGAVLSEEEFYLSSRFLEAIDNYPVVQDVNCNDILLETLSTALRTDAVATYPYSPIFLFTDGLTDDGEDVQMRLQQQLSFWRGQIFFILASNGQCKIDMVDPSYITLRRLAQFSHGLVSVVETPAINDLVFNIASSLVMGSCVMANDFLHSCARAPEYQTFFIDDKIDRFYIIATGTSLKVSYIMPSLAVESPGLEYATGNTYIWSSKVVEYGSYLLQVRSESTDAHPCQYRVIGHTNSNLFVALSDSLTEDITMRQPVWRHDSHIVARMTDVEFSMNSQEIHAEAVIWTNEGQQDKREVLYASNGIYRDSCGYNLYFGAWKCQTPLQTFAINIFVTDVRGYTMMRTLNGFCSADAPTEAPPEGCQNGGYPLGNDTCLCQARYSGAKCETIECLNSGTSMGSVCSCVAGFTGQFCEYATCHDSYPVDWTPHGRSLSIMLHDSVTTRTSLRSISENIGRVLENALSHNAEWFKTYQVFRFNDTGYSVFSDLKSTGEVLQSVKTIHETNRLRSEVSCAELYVMPMILDALSRPEITENGYILLFLNGYMKYDTLSMMQLYEELEATRVQLNVVLLSSSPCGKGLDEYGILNLMNLAEFSGGRFFLSMPSKAGEVLKIIPTFYRSSYLYENYVMDCTVPQTFYFPVDSQTQAFTAYILGDLDDDPKYLYPNPDANALPDKYYVEMPPINVLKDYGTGTRLDQIIRECDEGWQTFDNHCWKFEVVYSTWREASTKCQEMGAVLATVYTQAEEDFLNHQAGNTNFWIGLNNIRNIDNWEWDHFGNNTLLLDDSGYSDWAANEPTTDQNKRCVQSIRKGSVTGWTASDCNVRLPSLCMKHAYDSEYEPEITGRRNDLVRGIWKLQVQTIDGPCHVQLFAQSGIELFNHFTDSIHYDNGHPKPYAEIENIMISHVTNQEAVGQGLEGKLRYAHIYQYKNVSLVHAERFTKRDKETCNYEWISDAFACSDISFLSMSTGVDRYGYMYQRLQNFYCFGGPNEDECMNGGVHANGKCICEPGYKGEYCEVPICIHGSLLAGGLGCNCSDDYAGALCDIPLCTRTGAVEVPNRYNKTFILALDGTRTSDGMAKVLDQIEDILTTVLNKANENIDWITHYTGIVFSDVPPDSSNVIEADSADDFVNKIKGVTQSSPGTISRPIIHALGSLLESESIHRRSELFIVTAGDISDADSASRVLSSIARKKVYVNVILIGDDSYPNNKNYNDPSISPYFDIVESSGGSFYQVPATAEGLKKFWTSLVSTLFDTYYITKLARANCSELVEYIQVGENATDLIIDAFTDTVPTIVVEDPSRSKITQFSIQEYTKTNHFVKFTTAHNAGLFKISVDQGIGNPGHCSIGIRGQSSLVVNIAFTSDVGIDGGLHSQDASLYPLAGDNFNAVVIATSSGTMNFVQIFSLDQRTLIWSSPLVKREHCTYPYISANVFRCTEATFVVAADGVDDDGFPIRRMIHIHCL